MPNLWNHRPGGTCAGRAGVGVRDCPGGPGGVPGASASTGRKEPQYFG